MRSPLRILTKVLRLASGDHHWQVFDFSGAVYRAGKAPTQRKAREKARAAKTKLVAT